MLTNSFAVIFQLPNDPVLLLTTLSVILTLTVTLSVANILFKKNLQPTFRYASIGELRGNCSEDAGLTFRPWSFIRWAVMSIRRKDAPDDGKEDHHFLFLNH